MIVHHLASKPAGGAGGATARLVDQLRRSGGTHRLFCAASATPSPCWATLYYSLPRPRGLRARLHRLLLSLAKKGRPRSPEPLSLAHLGTTPPPEHELWNCDILHLHWLGDGWLDFAELARRLPPRLPVVWTLHDLNAVTAICHYPGEHCDCLPTGCQQCPWVGGPGGRRILRDSFAAKHAFFAAHHPHLVSICHWQDALVRASPLGHLATDIRLIRNAFAFYPETAPPSRASARHTLGLAPRARYLLLGASNLDNPRKGTDLVLDLAPPGWTWMAFGDGSDKVRLPPDTVRLGRIDDPARLNLVYAAADLFVLPSREECLAQTGLEALAQGTPVLTFANTGPADYVIPGQTGLLATPISASALRQAIGTFPDHPSLSSQTAVRAAFSRLYAADYAPAVVTAQYGDLYTAACATTRCA